MNWFRQNKEQPRDDENPPPSANPDANELRRRRLAKLEEADAAEKARRKDFEERKAQWQAKKKAEAEAAVASATVASATVASAPETTSQPSTSAGPSIPSSSSIPAPIATSITTTPTPSAHPPPPEPSLEPQPKRAAPALPSVEKMVSRAVSRIFAIAHSAQSVSDEATFYPDLIAQLRKETGISDDEPLILNSDSHPDDILLNRINADPKPLEYLFGCFVRFGQQRNDITSNRRLQGDENKQRRIALTDTVEGIERRIYTYTAMLLSGAFMEIETANSQALAEYLLNEKVPAGFLRALIKHTESEEASFDDLIPVFKSVFIHVRSSAKIDSKLSSSSFLKPLKALATLVSHKELCRLLTSQPEFIPAENPKSKLKLMQFAHDSYLYPFFQVSALPGAPVGQPPLFPEDPSIASTMFPNPTMLDRAEVEGRIYSLRASLSVARNLLAQICLVMCKSGPEPRNSLLTWFAKVFNLNKKRAAMRPDPQLTSRDGFMLNIMFVLLKLCDPIVAGGWEKLQKVDPTYPQSKHRVDYSDETRLAADTDMLKRWWVDQRNQNAQESLTRQLEVAARESGLSNADGGSSSSAGASGMSEENAQPAAVATEFNFVTECFWMALRAVQLGFVPVINFYEEDMYRTLQRMKEVIRDMEAENERGTLPPTQQAQLPMIKQRFDMMMQATMCYDVYVQDPELLRMLICFVTADAEWILKKLLIDPKREDVLPLPLPVDRTFASLPEHTVETITAVLLTVMRTHPRIMMEHHSLLEEMVSFCVVASASPLHIKNPYLRAKLIEFLSMIFPRTAPTQADDDDDKDEQRPPPEPAMEALFAGHQLSRKFLPGSLFRLYVDVEHTGSHTQFYDKFSIRYRIGTIIESLWYLPDYHRSVQNEARDQSRFLRFVNMVLNDANHLLDSVLDDLEEMHSLETLMQGGPGSEWDRLSDNDKREKQERLQRLEGSAKSYNLLANSNVKLLLLLTGDSVVKRIFLRDEMVSRLAEMLNYLLERLCGQRCSDLKVSNPEKVSWKPRQLLKRIMETYTHFVGDEAFATAIARDGRSYKKDLFVKATAIARTKRLLRPVDIQTFLQVAEAAERAHEADNEEEEDLGEIPDEFLDPIMNVLMRNPVKLPTSGNVVDRAVISRILLSDKVDPFNRKLLTEDMLVEDVELKRRIDDFVQERRRAKRGS